MDAGDVRGERRDSREGTRDHRDSAFRIICHGWLLAEVRAELITAATPDQLGLVDVSPLLRLVPPPLKDRRPSLDSRIRVD